jgi:hypothetical protein
LRSGTKLNYIQKATLEGVMMAIQEIEKEAKNNV